MALVIDCVLIDCVDLDAMTTFWCGALDLEHVWTGPSGGHLLVATDGSDRRLGLMPRQGGKAGKNRVHFDLRPDDQHAEVRRLEALGARRVDIGQVGVTWVVMADPEGNEFCVLRSLAQKEQDLAASARPIASAGVGKTCPRCGTGFRCHAPPTGGSTCWCDGVAVDQPTLQRLALTYDGCLCPRCLRDEAQR